MRGPDLHADALRQLDCFVAIIRGCSNGWRTPKTFLPDIIDTRLRDKPGEVRAGLGQVHSADELRRLLAAIGERIDTLEAQFRLYPTTTQTFTERYLIGARTVEERADYWIIR
jgi:CRISPR-associated protein Cas2